MFYVNQKHLAVVDEIADANYVSHSVPGLPPGREGLKAFVSAFHAAFPDGHLNIEQMIAEGDTVAARVTFRGTHTGDFLGIPATDGQARRGTRPGYAPLCEWQVSRTLGWP